MCLDSDDVLDPYYIEKCVAVLEADPSVSLVTSGIKAFGVSDWSHIHTEYDPKKLFSVNLACTASMYRKEAWEDAGGYKSNIGYEDWELWLSMAEKGHFGRRIPELLFKYRTANSSRFIEDKLEHDSNIIKIQKLHPNYLSNVKKIVRERKYQKEVVEPSSAFVNLNRSSQYSNISERGRNRVLLVMPWMAFGGAETLILNFSRELKDKYDITFMTGLQSEHMWQNRFEEISKDIYHLSNMFDNRNLYLEFISNYVSTHNVKILHILHTDYVHEILGELKRRHPELKIIITMFNSRVEHFPEIKKIQEHIDIFTSDNLPVTREYVKLGVDKLNTRVIPNGIDSANSFNPETYDREKIRVELGLNDKEIAVFFVGRLSSEKNPDVFLKAASILNSSKEYGHVKFYVVGDGPMKSSIEKMTTDLNNVEYLGYRTDIGALLLAADVFVLPSSIEGFPLSILEALSMETVCIASSVGAIPDIIDEGVTGFVVEPGNVNSVVDSIHYLSKNLDKLEKMQKNARKTVIKLYSNEILGINYKKLYKEVLKK